MGEIRSQMGEIRSRNGRNSKWRKRKKTVFYGHFFVLTKKRHQMGGILSKMFSIYMSFVICNTFELHYCL